MAQLPKDQLAEFRAWYEQFDAEIWDRQIEEDGGWQTRCSGRGRSADHKAGRTKQLGINIPVRRFGVPMKRFPSRFRS